MDRLKKSSTVKDTAKLPESRFFEREQYPTDIPMLNVALSGELGGGVSSGVLTIAGPSKHFKSSFGLVIAKAFLDANPDAVILFYDTEFGTPESYFRTFGIDPERVLHTPIQDVEQMKFDIMAQLKTIEEDDKVIIIVDSVGNMASRKEIDDAENEKAVADMTRARGLKGLFRMVTSQLTIKDIPMICINHTYKEIGLFPKDVVGGGTGIYYASDAVWIVGRRQRKNTKGVIGYDFIINVDKSRFVKEKSLIPITVEFDGGISQYSGLLDVAVAGGFVKKVGKGRFQHVKDGELVGKVYTQKKTQTDEFCQPLLDNPDFAVFVEKVYKLTGDEASFEEDDFDEE